MKLEVFKNSGFEIRGGLINNEPYFVAKDVCAALGVQNSREALNRLDDDEKGVISTYTPGGIQSVSSVNESGLYSLILSSRKPEAKKFRKWVTSEVLPTIRKHGAYLTPEKVEEALLNPDTIIQLAIQLKAERAEKLKALQKTKEQEPMVKFAKRVGSCASTLSIQDFAKVISDKTKYTTGQNRLYSLLKNAGFLMRDNKPYQKYIDMGIFEVKEATYINTSTNEPVMYLKTRVTAKGQMYLLERIDQIIEKSA